MSIRKVFSIVLIFIAILTVFRFTWLHLFATPDHPHAIQGELDLSNWEQISDYSITLDGEWEFYPNTFIMGNDRENESIFIQVPGDWTESATFPDTYGFGSYRLKISIDPEKGSMYGIRIPNISSSSELYINGELQMQVGRPAKDKQQYEPLNFPYSTFFTTGDAREIELVIQVANYDSSLNGGIVHSLKFGLADNLIKSTSFETNIVIVACVIYLFHAMYSFIVYLVGNRDRQLLYFSLMIVCVVLGTLSGERLLFAWLPLNFEWGVKVTYLTMIAGGYFLLQSLRQQLPVFLRTKIFIPYAILSGVLVLLIFILQAKDNFSLHLLYNIVMLIPCLLVIFVMFRATAKIDKENIFLLLAVVAAIGSLIWLLIIEAWQIEMVSYPFDLMIALTCFATYWFKQYFRILDESRKMTIKLQEADKVKDDFLVTVAHEMRNPLHGILNISQSVVEREKGILREKSVQDLELLMTVGRRMSLLLNDLLELAKIRENRISMQLEDVSIHSVAESVIDMLRYMTEGKPLALVNRIPSDFPHVFTDENRLNQILFNLLYNGIKYTHAGEVSVHASIQGEWAKISVSDTGIGMDEEFLEKAFQPYEQVTHSTPTTDSGFGLGLAICKQLIELHGGTLEVSSKLNHGSVFTFTLRLSDTSTQAEIAAISLTEARKEQNETVDLHDKSELASENMNFGSVRILAVDDDPVNLKVLESIFSMAPYEIVTVTSAQEALAMLDAGRWDLVISDVMMPKMSGYSLTTRIRERYSMLELPVLLLTAYSRDEDIEAGFRAGANDYVTKPMNAVELKSRVKSLTKLKRSVSERLRMEAAWLQAQIKPHFMINTFNAIVALSRLDLDRMDDLIQELSNYIRLSIDFQNTDGVAPLECELQLVRSYLFIMKQRFGDRLNVVWEVDENIPLDIPPLTIQPLVENAISHGILKRPEGGDIHICIKDQGRFAKISIIDNGVGMDEETLKQLLNRKSEKRKGIGLLNIERRLKQLFGNGLKIESKLGEGTTISFMIPKTENRQDD